MAELDSQEVGKYLDWREAGWMGEIETGWKEVDRYCLDWEGDNSVAAGMEMAARSVGELGYDIVGT